MGRANSSTHEAEIDVTTLYHTTGAADEILRHGFRATPRGYVLIDGKILKRRAGVYLADGLVGEAGGAKGHQMLAVDVPADVDLAPYRIEDHGLGFTEWAIPARVVNRWPRRQADYTEVFDLILTALRVGTL